MPAQMGGLTPVEHSISSGPLFASQTGNLQAHGGSDFGPTVARKLASDLRSSKPVHGARVMCHARVAGMRPRSRIESSCSLVSTQTQ